MFVSKLNKKSKSAVLIAIAAVGLQSLTGCKIDETSMLGKKDRHNFGGNSYDYGGTNSCAGATGQSKGKVTSTDREVAGCAVPRSALSKVEAGYDGVIRVSLKKLADGKFPSIAILTYAKISYGYYDTTVPYLCFAGAVSPDGETQESLCRTTSALRIGPANLASTDRHAAVTQVTVANTTCGSLQVFTVGSMPSACGRSELAAPDTVIDGVSFPDLYIENAAY